MTRYHIDCLQLSSLYLGPYGHDGQRPQAGCTHAALRLHSGCCKTCRYRHPCSQQSICTVKSYVCSGNLCSGGCASKVLIQVYRACVTLGHSQLWSWHENRTGQRCSCPSHTGQLPSQFTFMCTQLSMNGLQEWPHTTGLVRLVQMRLLAPQNRSVCDLKYVVYATSSHVA